MNLIVCYLKHRAYCNNTTSLTAYIPEENHRPGGWRAGEHDEVEPILTQVDKHVQHWKMVSQETRWSWLAMFCCGFCVMLSFTPAVSSGVFFVEWVHAFDVDRELASLPFSLNMGIMFMMGKQINVYIIMYPSSLLTPTNS